MHIYFVFLGKHVYCPSSLHDISGNTQLTCVHDHGNIPNRQASMDIGLVEVECNFLM